MANRTTKAQRDAIIAHLADPTGVTQASVMRKLKLNHQNDFYRLTYRVIRDHYPHIWNQQQTSVIKTVSKNSNGPDVVTAEIQ
jgi:hypothetical protein